MGHRQSRHTKSNVMGHQVRFHPDSKQVSKACRRRFLKGWSFPSAKHKKNFIDFKFYQFGCAAFPDSLSERFPLIVDFTTVMLLLNDIIDTMQGKDRVDYALRIISIFEGRVEPQTPVEQFSARVFAPIAEAGEWHVWDIIEGIRKFVDAAQVPTKDVTTLRHYIQVESNAGYPYYSALMRYSLALKYQPQQDLRIMGIDKVAACQALIFNDLVCFDHKCKLNEILFCAVKVMVEHEKRDIKTAKEIILLMAMEMYDVVVYGTELLANDTSISQDAKVYLLALPWFLSGHEHWIASIYK
ncbi:Aristolochene synthase [Neolecta irregularis DAH-3]|uniref:Aristolochene synthase n=1 Tax=Neolecta irregularis (strain DAH-3) TaxID=1198029 RepID=A0A1U7LW40_NEOID|nr:Aristolochene synthase [Neolecta irregularis DAH-3]|eukprot:OLL26838.1 Aristolochene synthase [Neolecta irregularis DAH-3]